MISAVVFSKDRPAQLDLLLRSLALNAPWLDDGSTVIYTHTSPDYRFGYDTCRDYHPNVNFVLEQDFREQMLSSIGRTDHVLLLCDDDVLYGKLPGGSLNPGMALNHSPEVLCVQLRLGLNATECYSLSRSQKVPTTRQFAFIRHEWVWRGAEGDWGYPGSVDGSIWRQHQLKLLLSQPRLEWSSPNEMEDALNTACQTALLPLMSCYDRSVIVGVPVNSVQSVYDPNRFASEHRAPLLTLLKRFREGRRLSLASVVASEVDSAHREFKLLWQQPGSTPEIGKKMAADSDTFAAPDPVSFQS